MQNHFINIPFSGSTAKLTIWNRFDYETQELSYVSNDGKMPVVYNEVYEYVKSLDARPIVFNPDYAMSNQTCKALVDKHTNLKVLYFTPLAHFNELGTTAFEFSKSILTQILGYCHIDFYLIGLNDEFVTQDDILKFNRNGVKYFTQSTIKKKDISKVIFDECIGFPVHVIYDMSVLSFESAPSTFRLYDKNFNGLDIKTMIGLLDKFRGLNIVGLDIAGFNLNNSTQDIPFKLTAESAKMPLIYLLGMKEKKINIFNENTKILICKPMSNIEIQKAERDYLLNKLIDSDDDNIEISDDEQDEQNYSWYIMRNIPTDLKEELIQKIMNIPSNILIYKFNNENMYISFTTIEEQEKKTISIAESIYDRTLAQGEKVNLMFSQVV